MAWYDAGTVKVTVNSATVTGTGTKWLAGARQGEAFVAPDGRLYEVLNIASDTSLTLTKPYIGATATGQKYALAPMQGYVKELADRVATLLLLSQEEWGSVLKAADLVGDVSAGAVMQSGSNASGSWVKLADGTMRTAQTRIIDMSEAAWEGSLPRYHLLAGEISFPAAFLANNPPDVVVSVQDSAIASRSAYVSFYRRNVTGISDVYLSSPTAYEGGEGRVALSIIAAGRWKV